MSKNKKEIKKEKEGKERKRNFDYINNDLSKREMTIIFLEIPYRVKSHSQNQEELSKAALSI